MKALVYLGPGRADVRDVAAPQLNEGEGLIRVEAAGICGTDLSILAGKHPRAKPPLIPGHEFYGELVETNDPEGRFDLKAGDVVVPFPLIFCGSCIACLSGNEHVCRRLRILGIDRDGGMGEYSSVPLDHLVKIDERIGPALGILIEPLAVVIHSMRESGVSVGDRVLVIGGGPIGFLLSLLLDFCGIREILVSEINPWRAKMLSELGFRVVNPLEESLERAVSDLTRGEGADVLFEVSAAPAAAGEMTELVRPRAMIVLVSVFKEPAPVDLRAVNFKEITLKGTRVYTSLDYERAIELVASARMPIEKAVTHRFPLERAEEALLRAANPEEALKVMIECRGG